MDTDASATLATGCTPARPTARVFTWVSYAYLVARVDGSGSRELSQGSRQCSEVDELRSAVPMDKASWIFAEPPGSGRGEAIAAGLGLHLA